MFSFLFTEEGEGQRKRKAETPEDDPAKCKSTGTDLVPPEDADTAASALKDLALVKKSEEQQMPGPETRLKAANTKLKQPCDKIASDNKPEESQLDDHDPGGRGTAIYNNINIIISSCC